jgi:hypothetical protein
MIEHLLGPPPIILIIKEKETNLNTCIWLSAPVMECSFGESGKQDWQTQSLDKLGEGEGSLGRCQAL